MSDDDFDWRGYFKFSQREPIGPMLGHQGNYRDIAIARRDVRRRQQLGTPGRRP
jgi:hypothetical protein